MGGVSFCHCCLELNELSVKGRMLKELFHDGGLRWKIMDPSDSQTALFRISSTWTVLSFAGSNILHLPVCGVWSSDGKWALHLKQWMESFRASVLNCKRDGNKLPPKCPFISLWAYSQFSMKKALSDVPFWFRYVFLMLFLFFSCLDLLSQLLFMKIFWSFLSVMAYLWSLFSSMWLVLHFFGVAEAMLIFFSTDLGMISILCPVLLVSQAGADTFGFSFSCSMLGFGCSCSAWQWWLYSGVPDGSTSCWSKLFQNVYLRKINLVSRLHRGILCISSLF